MLNLLGWGALKGSGNNTAILRQAEGTPEAFMPPEGSLLDTSSCKSPMIDGKDGTEIILVSSANGKGNYRVVPYKYGLKKGELLGVDCSTGRAMGIVKE